MRQVSVFRVNGSAGVLLGPRAPPARLAVPVVVTVTVCDTDEPVLRLPKGTERSVAGATESVTEIAGVGTAAPVPLTFTITELFALSLLGILKLSEKAATEAGEKTTFTVQEADGAMV